MELTGISGGSTKRAHLVDKPAIPQDLSLSGPRPWKTLLGGALFAEPKQPLRGQCLDSCQKCHWTPPAREVP